MLKELILATAATLALSGCASSGPVQIGPDSYMTANTGVWSWSSGAALKADLYRDAATFCHAQGKQIMPAHTSQNDGSFSDFGHAELEFSCLAQGDPGLVRPYTPNQPNVVIENRTGQP